MNTPEPHYPTAPPHWEWSSLFTPKYTRSYGASNAKVYPPTEERPDWRVTACRNAISPRGLVEMNIPSAEEAFNVGNAILARFRMEKSINESL